MCVCLLPHNLREYFVSLLVEPIAGKNVSPSDKKLWRLFKNVSVAEKSYCKVLSINRHLEISSLLLIVLSIGRHLEISSLLLMSAENTETLTFVSLKLCFLGCVHHHELFFSYLWSFVHKFTSSSTNFGHVTESSVPSF